MKRVACLIGLLTATTLAAPLAAQEPVEEREHVVRRGDTLWDLAAYYFSDPFDWPTIYEANTTVVEDPHWIYPDEVLVIPGIRGDTEPEPRVAMGGPESPIRTVFYRPPPVQPQDDRSDSTLLSEPTTENVPVKSGVFNAAPFVGDPDDLDVRGVFIAALRENREVGTPPTAHPQDEVYMTYEGIERPAIDQRLLLIRVGERMDGGRVLEPTGVIRVTRLEDEVMFGRIETQYGEVHRGQLATTMPVYPDFAVEEAEEVEGGYDLEGRVIEFVDDPPLPSIADIGFVDLGGRDGVQVGDVFTAYIPRRAARGRRVSDAFARVQQLPSENVARLRVVRVGDRVATVRVERLMLTRLEDGIRVRRTHRIP
ncbi:MAG: LysM peptidoglycan-binding domain-containing protein [Longimicrobiales bacterium]